MYWIVWSFDVKPEHVRDFERAYGPRGEWARLFERAAGFEGTDLRREPGRVPRYVTIDRWRSRDDYRRFKQAFETDYRALDARCARMTESERQVGAFETSSEENRGARS